MSAIRRFFNKIRAWLDRLQSKAEKKADEIETKIDEAKEDLLKEPRKPSHEVKMKTEAKVKTKKKK